MFEDPIEVVAVIAQAFDRLGISYLVGGSFASSAYGIPRSTLDVDLVANIGLEHAGAFAALLSADFHVDDEMIREAIERGRAFNVIHRNSLFKADVFVMKDDDWSVEEMKRARTETLLGAAGPVKVRFATAEDTLLHKLAWYKLGDESSERQWGDIGGLMKVYGPRLDDRYLDTWAPHLEVEVLLARARAEFSAG